MSAIDEEQIKKNVADKETWLRLVYMAIFAVAFYFGSGLLFAMALLQFLAKLFTGKILGGLLRFGVNLATYLGQIAHYLSYTSNEKPFPFADFPAQQVSLPQPEPAAEPRSAPEDANAP